MKKLDIQALILPSHNAAFFHAIGQKIEIEDSMVLTSSQKDKDIEDLVRLETHCNELGLIASAATARKLLELEKGPQPTYGRTRDLWLELSGRLNDELEGSLLMFIEPDKVRFFTKLDLFGAKVAEKFPSAIQDIEEAGKCLALGRNTACVFHLMRVLEAGLRALGTSLGDPTLDANANPTWDRILKRGDLELLKTADKRSKEWQSKPEFFTDAIANLRAVKTAWRNPTMHVIGVYDEEKALDVFNTVGALMRHLATELQEAVPQTWIPAVNKYMPWMGGPDELPQPANQ